MGRPCKFIRLSDEQVLSLNQLVKTGFQKAKTIFHAQVLLKNHQGINRRQICADLNLHYNTVTQILSRYQKEGLQAALEEKPRSGQPRKITPEIEAQVTRIACSSPPEGHSRWTVQMITDQLIELKCLDWVSDETIRGVLKKANLNPGKNANGVSEKLTASI